MFRQIGVILSVILFICTSVDLRVENIYHASRLQPKEIEQVSSSSKHQFNKDAESARLLKISTQHNERNTYTKKRFLPFSIAFTLHSIVHEKGDNRLIPEKEYQSYFLQYLRILLFPEHWFD